MYPLVHVVVRARASCTFFKEPERRFIEHARRAFAKLHDAPRLMLQLVVELLRLLSIGCASSLSNATAARRADVNVPDVTAFALSDGH
ncbi:hypothetical protein WS67_12020 [Burkholderia singularis]|uniref:Uncharacterized protein n=1 Tax=Burkholderia singularis TaxID=1503053 RepID=A0A103E2M0_9BURK|nr:hypothetical protein WS67_12020 [Burkholderia singularis]KVE33717.1 hypothetical protein WS68_11115 [Burkholderia sp. TSV86]